MEIVSYSSSKGAISVGVNFNPMYRHRIFKYRPLKEFCVSKLKEAAQIHGQKCQFKLDEVGLDIDHAHVLVTFGPNTKLSDIIKKLKQHSAKELFKAFPWLRGRDTGHILSDYRTQKLFTKNRFWSPGYYFESYGKRTFDSHKEYVAKQGVKNENKQQTRLNQFIAS